jgi:hypothetical protein
MGCGEDEGGTRQSKTSRSDQMGSVRPAAMAGVRSARSAGSLGRVQGQAQGGMGNTLVEHGLAGSNAPAAGTKGGTTWLPVISAACSRRSLTQLDKRVPCAYYTASNLADLVTRKTARPH